MNRDALTTIGGLVLVGIVVVATFLYGNQQRQAQLRHNQTAQRQAQQSAKPQPAAKTPASASSSPVASSQQPAVQKPSSSNQSTLQGGSTAPTPAATNDGSAQTEIPKTGSSGILYIIGATLMVLLYRTHRQSRLAVVRASLKAAGLR
jgi:hypothetical protein